MAGLINKYIISKTDGSPVDPDAKYFILRLDPNGNKEHVIACRKAINTYLQAIREYLPELSHDLYKLYGTHKTVMVVKEINDDNIKIVSVQIGDRLVTIEKNLIPDKIFSNLKINDLITAQCNLDSEELYFYDFEMVDPEIIEKAKSFL